MSIPPEAFVAGGKAVAWLWDKYGKDLADKAVENFKKKRVDYFAAAQLLVECLARVSDRVEIAARILQPPEGASEGYKGHDAGWNPQGVGAIRALHERARDSSPSCNCPQGALVGVFTSGTQG